ERRADGAHVAPDVERAVGADGAREDELRALVRLVAETRDLKLHLRHVFREGRLGGAVEEAHETILEADLVEPETHGFEQAFRLVPRRLVARWLVWGRLVRGRRRRCSRLGRIAGRRRRGAAEELYDVEPAVLAPLNLGPRATEARLGETDALRPV